MNGSSAAWTTRPGWLDQRDEAEGAASGVVILRRRKTIPGRRVTIVELIDRADATEGGLAQLGETAVEPTHLDAQPAYKIPVVDPILGPLHGPCTGREVDRRVGGDHAIEPVQRPRRGFRGELESEAGSQREADQGDGRAGGPRPEPGHDRAQVVRPSGVVDPPRQAESRARSPQVHPDHSDPHRHQLPGEPEHVRRTRTSRQPVHQDGGRVARAPVPGHRFQHAQPIAVVQDHFVADRRQVNIPVGQVAAGDRLGVAGAKPGMGLEGRDRAIAPDRRTWSLVQGLYHGCRRARGSSREEFESGPDCSNRARVL